MQDKLQCLSIDDVLGGYSAVSKLYPHIPPLSMWRAWEYAAYQRYGLPEPVLDIGCGDGHYFRLVWPKINDVVGVDIDPAIVNMARDSGIYKEVHFTPAHKLSFQPAIFASVFANCSLEHMDNLSGVLQSIARTLQPGGSFLLSVVTDKLLEWFSLPSLISSICSNEAAIKLKNEYLSFHHLVNALTPNEWTERLESAGFDIIHYVPIVPELFGRAFLLLDNLWHVKHEHSEIGDVLHQYFTQLVDFPVVFGQLIKSLLVAEKNWEACCGAVIYAKKKIP